ncbi:hypothetical protein FACS189427_10050 [Planctomycetales bacterium]|nr:hypothetical protein FACS189427_10050 [Planctomycetales bacterium]
MKRFKSFILAAVPAVIVFCIFAVSNCAYGGGGGGTDTQTRTENRPNKQGPIKTHKYDWRKGSAGFQSGIQGNAVSGNGAGNLGNDYVEINSSYQGVTAKGDWSGSLRKDSTAIKIKSDIKSGK